HPGGTWKVPSHRIYDGGPSVGGGALEGMLSGSGGEDAELAGGNRDNYMIDAGRQRQQRG
ncbi:hypothetical protein BJV78DRAFT_1245198, partial [Lactifluus subvellereus]